MDLSGIRPVALDAQRVESPEWSRHAEQEAGRCGEGDSLGSEGDGARDASPLVASGIGERAQDDAGCAASPTGDGCRAGGVRGRRADGGKRAAEVWVEASSALKPFRPTAYFEARSRKDAATGCWNWALSRDSKGYGFFRDADRISLSHRGSWRAANGPIPEGLLVCHRCDTPSCVNPAHLFLGTHDDNMRDCVAKGRRPRGSLRVGSKLTEADVRIIRLLVGLGVRRTLMAALYGVSQPTISVACSGRTWRHVAPLSLPAEVLR